MNTKSRYIDSRSVKREEYFGGSRIDLNDLLKRRLKEKKVDRKTNLIILSGASTVAVVAIVILIL